MKKSYFDGGVLPFLGWYTLAFLVTSLTAGILFPYVACAIYEWEAEHTVINGKRLKFNGGPGELFGKWIKWYLLTAITIGFYVPWMVMNVKKWRAKHTHFAEE